MYVGPSDDAGAADAPGDPANSPLASSPATAARPMRCTTSMFPSSEIDRMRLRVHPWAIASRHVDATVDVNGFADDETRGVRHQESDDLADFSRLADPAERNIAYTLLP